MTKDEVDRFLNQFHTKLAIFDIIFLGREKNQKALLELGITGLVRLELIKQITVRDYSEKIEDALNGYGDMWVFGKDFNGNEIYIKIALGVQDKNTICISFHKAEHKMNYPFKK